MGDGAVVHGGRGRAQGTRTCRCVAAVRCDAAYRQSTIIGCTCTPQAHPVQPAQLGSSHNWALQLHASYCGGTIMFAAGTACFLLPPSGFCISLNHYASVKCGGVASCTRVVAQRLHGSACVHHHIHCISVGYPGVRATSACATVATVRTALLLGQATQCVMEASAASGGRTVCQGPPSYTPPLLGLQVLEG